MVKLLVVHEIKRTANRSFAILKIFHHRFRSRPNNNPAGLTTNFSLEFNKFDSFINFIYKTTKSREIKCARKYFRNFRNFVGKRRTKMFRRRLVDRRLLDECGLPKNQAYYKIEQRKV